MDDKTAFEVESALIDAYPGLTNIVGERVATTTGPCTHRRLSGATVPSCRVQPAQVLLISVNRSATETSLYEATRYAWKVKKSKAEQAEVVLATRQGEIVVPSLLTVGWKRQRRTSRGATQCPDVSDSRGRYSGGHQEAVRGQAGA